MKAARLVLLIPLAAALALSQPTPPLSSSAKSVAGPVVTVPREPTTIDAKGFLGVIGQNITPHATLKNKATGAPIAGRKLKFTIRGNAAGDALTDASGVATIHYQVPNDPPGNWPVEIRFDGGLEWLASDASVTMGVFKASTKLTLDPSPNPVREKQSLSIGGRLVRTSDGTGVSGRVVALTVNGKAAGKPATTNGSFTLEYKVPDGMAPKAHVEAQFEGDVLYAASANKVDVPVKPPFKEGRLVAFDARGRLGETVTVKAMLIPQNPMLTVNGQVGGARVSFTRWRLQGSDSVFLCNTETVPDGRASCTVKLDTPGLEHSNKGPYFVLRAAAGFDGDWHVPDKVDAALFIDPSPVRLVVSGPSSARIGDTLHLKVKLTRTTDNAAIGNRSITIGGNHTETTNTAGEANFSFAVPAAGGTGPRTFKATFVGQPDAYDNGEGSITIQVLPSVS